VEKCKKATHNKKMFSIGNKLLWIFEGDRLFCLSFHKFWSQWDVSADSHWLIFTSGYPFISVLNNTD